MSTGPSLIFLKRTARAVAFSRRLGLVNFQGLRKPAFYAYQFLNRLGDREIASSDSESWACRDAHGAQLLFWNYTPPLTKESDQKFLLETSQPKTSVRCVYSSKVFRREVIR